MGTSFSHSSNVHFLHGIDFWQVPKRLNEEVNEAIKVSQIPNDFLPYANRLLQRIKIALDMITRDLANAEDTQFQELFGISADMVNQVLTEMRVAMEEMSVNNLIHIQLLILLQSITII